MNENCWLKDKCNHIDCDKFCLKNFKLNYLYERAYISLPQRKYVSLILDEDLKDLNQFKLLASLSADVENFVNNGSSLYIHSGKCGNGKTSWALRFVQNYFNKIWYNASMSSCRALFISVPRLLLALKNNISKDDEYATYIKENVISADIVIWDDIATKQSTEFESENLFSMIDARISLGRSNIFTSNLSNEELHKALGDRLSSRITGSTYNVELKGNDKRRLK